MVDKFSRRLAPLGIVVRELTGDMQLTKREIAETQMIVTTPEKWDVVTRKAGDGALVSTVRLLIIDEVHLLHEERGAVIESVVARTLRLVETSQTPVRIVGLSATLPNYADVAVFLRVDPYTGLHFFDSSYRPVPLEQTFIGVTEHNPIRRKLVMNEICFKKVLASVQQGHQVMVFVHSRKETVTTAQFLREQFHEAGRADLICPDEHPTYEGAKQALTRSRNHELKELFNAGLSFHNAGMLRSDRGWVEKYFTTGAIRVLVCTATLAWGVNLPAHTVACHHFHTDLPHTCHSLLPSFASFSVTAVVVFVIMQLTLLAVFLHLLHCCSGDQINRDLRRQEGWLCRAIHARCHANLWSRRSSAV